MARIHIALIVFVSLLIGAVNTVDANDVWRGGSSYAHFGVGLPHDFSAAYADGMGLSGVALYDNRFPSIANPAGWSRAYFTNISGVFEIRSHEAAFGENEASTTQFQTGPFQMVLPVKRDRIGISLSISPLTNSRFSLENEYPIPPGENHSGEELRYIVENRGSGGINKIEAGIGVRLTNSISVGYAPSLLLGVINRNQDIGFNNSDYRPVFLQESTSHYGFGNRFGLYISKQNAFRSDDRAALGAMVSLPVNLVSERSLESRINSRDVSIHPPSYYGDGQTTYPLEASAGFSYNVSPYLLFSSDVLYQNWSGYTNFEGQAESFLKDRTKFGLGTQFMAARMDGNSFFSRFVYRMGLSYDTGSLVLDGNDIETLTINAGLGIPSSRTNSSVDINAEYGFRGSDTTGLIAEKVFAIKVAFNLSEFMFRQRRLQ